MKKMTNSGSWACFSRLVKRGAIVIILLVIGFMIAVLSQPVFPAMEAGEGNEQGDYIPPSKGGDIKFQPEGGTYTGKIQVRLIPGSLKSMRDDYIPSYICYTLDGSEPSRSNGKKYPGYIHISVPGTVTLKARLISKVGMYEGDVCSRNYIIRMNNTQNIIPSSISTSDRLIPFDTDVTPSGMAGLVTNLESLDQETRDEIELKTEKIIIDAPGITNVRLESERVVRMQLIISNMGKARVSDISGFTVEPAYKLSEVKTSLVQKFQNIKFSPPTIEANPVEVRLWLEFDKIAKFYEKVIFEKQGSWE